MHSSSKISFFTRKEKIVVILFVLSLLIGSGFNLYNVYLRNEEPIEANIQELNDFEEKVLAIVNKDTVENIVKIKKRSVEKQNPLYFDINIATKEDLEQLPYIGPVLSQRIIDYRKKTGRISTLNELVNVKGIGDKKLNKIKPYLKIVN